MGGRSVNPDSKSGMSVNPDSNSGRSVSPDSKYQERSEDWISTLPDDILVVIVSSLSLKEFAQTSILSSRWRNLWRHTLSLKWRHTLCLNFDDEEALQRISYQVERVMTFVQSERCKYINWVNWVLQSHKFLTLEEFRICFDLDNSDREAITKWLKFAFARQVERLELNLSIPAPRRVNSCEINYDFPMPAQLITSPLAVKSLKSLRLIAVNVSGDDISFFLRECPLLEELTIHGSHNLVKLEVCGPSLALKHLEVCYCYPFKSSKKVSAPNLTTLKVMSLDGLLLENVPKLVEVYLISPYDDFFVRNLVPTLALCISQLEVLTLDISTTEDIVELWNFPQVQLLKLKKLNVITYAVENHCLIGLISFIRASPQLEEFEVKLHWRRGRTRMDEDMRNVRLLYHSHKQPLKVLKFSGYHGRLIDGQLLKGILHSVVVEKIIIDTRYQPINGYTPPAEEEYWSRKVEYFVKPVADYQLQRMFVRYRKNLVFL